MRIKQNITLKNALKHSACLRQVPNKNPAAFSTVNTDLSLVHRKMKVLACHTLERVLNSFSGSSGGSC